MMIARYSHLHLEFQHGWSLPHATVQVAKEELIDEFH